MGGDEQQTLTNSKIQIFFQNVLKKINISQKWIKTYSKYVRSPGPPAHMPPKQDWWITCEHFIFLSYSDPNMRLRNTSIDGSDGSQLFDDTSGATPASQMGYKYEHSSTVCIVWALTPQLTFFSPMFIGRNQQAGPESAAYPGQSLLSDPMSNLAMAYGSSLASQGKEMMDKNVNIAY